MALASTTALSAESGDVLRRLGAQELLRRAGLHEPAEMAQAEAELSTSAEKVPDNNIGLVMGAGAKSNPLPGGGQEVSMDDVEKKLAQVGMPSDAISSAVDEAVASDAMKDPEEMSPAERATATARVADAVAADEKTATPGGHALHRDPWLAFASSLEETGVGSKCTTTCTRNRRTKMNKCETICEPHAVESARVNAVSQKPALKTAEVTKPLSLEKDSEGEDASVEKGEENESADSADTEQSDASEDKAEADDQSSGDEQSTLNEQTE